MTDNTPDYKDNLTEQWRKGELPEGYYYIKTRNETNIDEYIQWYKDHGIPSEKSFAYFNVQQILAPVPSYEEYISLVNWKEDLTELCTVKERIIEKYENIGTWWKAEYDELKEQNAQLKELLKECKECIEWYKADCGYQDAPTNAVLTKIDEVLK